MNRRGIATYYLAAWICGSTFASAAIWLRNRGAASSVLNASPAGAGFFFFCFVGLILGFVPALLEAFLLWLAARAFHLRGWLPWAIAGMVVAVGATAALGYVGGGASPGAGGHEEKLHALEMLTQGPALLIAGGWWMPAVPGALTGFVLSRIESAFSAFPHTAGNPQPGQLPNVPRG
jgi:hypothetical protein